MPAEDVAILDLQVNFAGGVDFERREIAFDASLFDSRVLSFRSPATWRCGIYWGDSAEFPAHRRRIPSGLSARRRWGSATCARLAICCSGQSRRTRGGLFRRHVEHGAVRRQDRAHAGAEHLQRLRLPVARRADPVRPVPLHRQIGAMLAVRTGSRHLFSVRLDLTLEGPTPWHARGRHRSRSASSSPSRSR